MKITSLAAAIVVCALSSPVVSAQDNTAPTAPAMGMDNNVPMTQMQENMKVMQQQIEKIQSTTDPKVRQKLMQEHMQTMQKNMQTMRGMGGPMMMASGQPGGMAMGGNEKMAGGHMMQHHAMMEKRMDMMQMMMEQMMQHDQATATTLAK